MSSNMPNSPQYTQRNGEPIEDCRDYLRTGRCKYGASCKYNHPPNVQSGGGMKTPIDPSEPMFPIRPNEPVCQYYMKHGTCKFGQACKFHHPPQAPLHAVMNGGTPVLMNVGRNTDAAPQLVLSPVGADQSGSPVMLQFLPQRPDEPDCIFFLKNGRCKYGATCRYHHPINYHQRRLDESRRRRIPSQETLQGQKIHYVSHPIATAAYPRGHLVVAEAPIAFMSLEGSTGGGQPAYQPIPIISSTDGVTSFCAPTGSAVVTDQGSSTSSIASSFDTATSSLEHLAAQGDAASALWNRSKRNGSGNSLSAYTESSAHGRAPTTRVVLPQSASDGNIARRTRAASYGSASDTSASQYYDANSSLSRNGSAGSWRNERTVPIDHNRRIPSSQYGGRSDTIPAGTGVPSEVIHSGSRSPKIRTSGPPGLASGRMRRGQRRSTRGENDEGFTMMTSALLNMLDTPEEASADSFSDEDPRPPPASYHNPSEPIDPIMFDRLSLNNQMSPLTDQEHHQHQHHLMTRNNDTTSWSPTWQESPRPTDGNDHAMAVMHPGHTQPPEADSPHTSDVGLYLP